MSTDTGGNESASLCRGRSGTDASHCWHQTGIGSGSIGVERDGTQVSEGHGTLVCCYCGERKPYTFTHWTPPVAHGPHDPRFR